MREAQNMERRETGAGQKRDERHDATPRATSRNEPEYRDVRQALHDVPVQQGDLAIGTHDQGTAPAAHAIPPRVCTRVERSAPLHRNDAMVERGAPTWKEWRHWKSGGHGRGTISYHFWYNFLSPVFCCILLCILLYSEKSSKYAVFCRILKV